MGDFFIRMKSCKTSENIVKEIFFKKGKIDPPLHILQSRPVGHIICRTNSGLRALCLTSLIYSYATVLWNVLLCSQSQQIPPVAFLNSGTLREN